MVARSVWFSVVLRCLVKYSAISTDSTIACYHLVMDFCKVDSGRRDLCIMDIYLNKYVKGLISETIMQSL